MNAIRMVTVRIANKKLVCIWLRLPIFSLGGVLPTLACLDGGGVVEALCIAGPILDGCRQDGRSHPTH